jgi:hypothetical protein
LFTQNQLLVGSVGDSVYVRELAVYDWSPFFYM